MGPRPPGATIVTPISIGVYLPAACLGSGPEGVLADNCSITYDREACLCRCPYSCDDYARISTDLFPIVAGATVVGDIVGGPAPVGPCCTGLSFMFPYMLAACPSNAVNALKLRHLAPPKFECRENFTNVFLCHYKKAFKAAYDMNLFDPISDNAQWKIGRGVHKVKNILQSKLYDKLEFEKTVAFVKREISTKKPKKARMIQGHKNEASAYHYPEEYQALNAALKAIGSEEITVDGVTFQFHYGGGLSHDELSDLLTNWSLTPHTIYDECDGANWDATMQEPTLQAEAAVYAMVGALAYLDVLIRMYKVKGKARCKLYDEARATYLRYQTCLKRLSGDFNTSIGNTIISMIVAFFVLLNLPPHLRPRKVRALFLGDDYLGAYSYAGLVPCPYTLRQALDEGWQSMGITPERGLFLDPLHVTFISMGVWPRQNGGYQFVPQPAKQLCKLFWSAKRLTPRQARMVSNGIAKSFWCTYHGFPLMMKFLKAHHDPNGKYTDWDHYFADKLTKKVRDVDWSRGFLLKYDVPLSSCTFDLPPSGFRTHVLAHPLIPHMLKYESLDPADRRWCVSRL